MKTEKQMIAKSEALEQVNLALRRAALLFHAFAETLIETFGDEEGQRLILKAITSYGTHIGKSARERAERQALSPQPENFQDDLPLMAWQAEEVIVEGERRTRIHHCPLAAVWQELGNPTHARLYCFVDQAKMQAFNPEFAYVHLKNMLDGDSYCELAVRSRQREGE